MTPARWTRTTVVPLLDSPDAATNKTAWWIAGRHPDWGAALRGYFDQRLAKAAARPSATTWSTKLTQFSSNPAIEELLASLAERRLARRARHRAAGDGGEQGTRAARLVDRAARRVRSRTRTAMSRAPPSPWRGPLPPSKDASRRD